MKIRVRELTDGRKFYDDELIEVRPADLTDSPGRSANEPSAGPEGNVTPVSAIVNEPPHPIMIFPGGFTQPERDVLLRSHTRIHLNRHTCRTLV
jgi:hypothetical protein